MLKELFFRIKRILHPKDLPQIALLEVKPGTKEADTLIEFYKKHKRGMITMPPQSHEDIQKEMDRNSYYYLVKNLENFTTKEGRETPENTIVGACGLEEKTDKESLDTDQEMASDQSDQLAPEERDLCL